MIKIYHNPRCSKSRQGLAILEKSGKPFETIKYLENPPAKKEIRDILELLGVTPEAIVRKNEPVWKENYKGKNLTDEEIVDAIAAHPKLLERPIVVVGDKAVVGRPPERIKEILG